MSRRAALAVALLVGLSGCVASTGKSSTPTGLPGLSLVPGPAGLSVAGSGGREIGFGRDQIGALASVARIEGAAPRAVPCTTSRTAFETAAGLRLVFERGTFVGWQTAAAGAGRICA